MYPARSCDRAIVKGQEFRLLNFIKMKLNLSEFLYLTYPE